MRRALAARDLAQVFRLLRKVGVSQRAIAAATGLAPSEVYEILRGRRVMAYEVRLLHAEATHALRRQLHITLADLHNLAGWTSLDVGLYRPARRHFAEAITQARQAGEPSLLANVIYRTGRLHLHRGLTVHALRFFQLGQIAARDAADPLAVAVLSANEAWAYGMLGDSAQAVGCLHRAREEHARAEPATAAPWVRFFGPADLDASTGMVHLGLAAADAPAADLSTARETLTASLAARGSDMARSRAFELTALATVCLRDHDPGEGIPLARQVAELVGELRSVRVIDRLAPLIDQLAATPGTDAAGLARQLSAAGAR
ncbi:MAG: hypothetical protein QG608_2447 [Actinomycetota bacterium]|nr:hypothetical protein [Actinomycetota bacterium]